MIEISEGFTSITAGSDSIDHTTQGLSQSPHDTRSTRPPTGARVTVEFRRERALPPEQPVTVRYAYGGDGNLREGTGIAQALPPVVRAGHAVVHHYRVSYWIPPVSLMEFVFGSVRYRTEELGSPPHPAGQQTLVR